MNSLLRSCINACTTVVPYSMHSPVRFCINAWTTVLLYSMHSQIRSCINACTTVLLPHSAYRTPSKSPAGLTISSAFLLPFLPWASAVLDYFSRVVMSNFNWRRTIKGGGGVDKTEEREWNGRGSMNVCWVDGKGGWYANKFFNLQIRKFADLQNL
jgi:hypothetical protein